MKAPNDRQIIGLLDRIAAAFPPGARVNLVVIGPNPGQLYHAGQSSLREVVAKAQVSISKGCHRVIDLGSE